MRSREDIVREYLDAQIGLDISSFDVDDKYRWYVPCITMRVEHRGVKEEFKEMGEELIELLKREGHDYEYWIDYVSDRCVMIKWSGEGWNKGADS